MLVYFLVFYLIICAVFFSLMVRDVVKNQDVALNAKLVVLMALVSLFWWAALIMYYYEGRKQ